MAFSKHLESYPAEILELFKRGCTESNYTIPCESRKEADKLRLCLYQVKYAILHQDSHPLKSAAASRQLSISRNNEVIFRSPEDSPLAAWGAKLLAASKGE